MGANYSSEIAHAANEAREAKERVARVLETLERMEKAQQETKRQKEEVERALKEAKRARQDAERARKEAEERWMAGIPPQLQPADAEKEHFRQRYGIDSQKVNIGVVGTSGTGKSSFLNSLRGLTPRSKGAAATGINETTSKVQGYPDTRNPNIVWYDVPGANTTRVKGWSYFVDHGLYCFDVLVVVFDNRFSQTTVTLLSNANRCFIPTLLVRTKADQLINNYIDDADDDITKEEAKDHVAQSTRQKVQADLERAGLPNQRVYVVSKAAMKELVANNHCSLDAIDEMDFLKAVNQGEDEDDEDYEKFDGDTIV